ncbi:MAG: FkbM family methyltransferase [Xanthomonadaceae bacterium]|nr:FkbM family methyltransferase [Xanthomonadaceae bacterium]
MHQADGFSDQVPQEFEFFGYPMLLPSKHVLTEFFQPQSAYYQPYRESGMVKIAQTLERMGRRGTAIDIGANIGDTCAILHRHCGLRIASIDASDFFFPYLVKNIQRHFADRATAQQAFVLAGRSDAPKGLYHWGGTAKAVDAPFSEHCPAIAIADLLATVENTALLKVDIDGFDIELIDGLFAAADAGDTPAPTFPIYFEYEFANGGPDAIRARCAMSLGFFERAAAAGYTRAFAWDDPGRFYGLIDIGTPQAVMNAINYMGHFRHRGIYGYDMCLVHASDTAFAAALCDLLQPDLVLPLPAPG